jgi:hypothetical protein
LTGTERKGYISSIHVEGPPRHSFGTDITRGMTGLFDREKPCEKIKNIGNNTGAPTPSPEKSPHRDPPDRTTNFTTGWIFHEPAGT